MSVVVLVREASEAAPVVHWAARFARSLATTLTVLRFRDSVASEASEEVAEPRAADPCLDQIAEAVHSVAQFGYVSKDDVRIVAIEHGSAVQATLGQVREDNAELLLFAADESSSNGGRNGSLLRLLSQSPCDTIALYCRDGRSPGGNRLMVATSDGAHDRAALAFCGQLVDTADMSLLATHVEDDFGEEAYEAGKRDLQAIMDDASLVESERVRGEVVMGQHPILDVADLAAEQDLVLVSAEHRRSVASLLAMASRPTIGLFWKAAPLRVWDPRSRLAEWIPQLNPVDYTDLFQNLQSGSRWNADFMVMLGLATAIASLGLLQNSPAVVIGSMLLAPLMTPMIGIGLALAQGNAKLARVGLQSIVRGFFMGLLIGFVLGYVTPSNELTPQLLARGEPNLLDLLVALFSGMAAAYALGRPNLIGAVAGVAIATALVPPLSTVGISASYGEWATAVGAATLLVTNVLAIILGAAAIFRLMGVTRKGREAIRTKWAYRTVVLLVLCVFGLAIPLGVFLNAQLHTGKAQPLAFPVTREVQDAIIERVARDRDVNLILIGRPGISSDVDPIDVGIVLSSAHPLPASYGDELTEIVREKMDNDEVVVWVTCLQSGWQREPSTTYARRGPD